jgi:hypothetical protein
MRHTRLSYAITVATVVGEPDRDHVPPPQRGSRGWLLLADNAMQQRLRRVRIRSSQQQAGVVTSEPGVERLHSAEVRNLDRLGGHRCR